MAYHVIFGTYGFWMPNDPRGSWSDWVASWELFRVGGPATKVDTTQSVAHRRHDTSKRLAAKRALLYPPVVFDGLQARAAARGFEEAAREADYRFYACCVLPEHVHLVVGGHERAMTRIVGHLKARAAQRLLADGLHPLTAFNDRDSVPTPWGAKCWKVFLDESTDVRRAIVYVERNPAKEGRAPQRWSFVTPFEY
jgi:REP element-mobilizing transposase RayT